MTSKSSAIGYNSGGEPFPRGAPSAIDDHPHEPQVVFIGEMEQMIPGHDRGDVELLTVRLLIVREFVKGRD